MRRSLLAVFLALSLAWLSPASAQLEAQKQVENSLLLTGTIDVAADGRVESVELNKVDNLPSAVLEFARNAALGWQFEPLTNAAGEAIPFRSPVSMLLVARPLEDDDFELRVRSASFNRYDPNDRTIVTHLRRPAPKYPSKALKARVQADVYLKIQVGRDGRVKDLGVQRVDLRAISRESEMRRWRAAFAEASLKTARDWTFRPPIEGPGKDREHWFVTVPVSFSIKMSGPGEASTPWKTYVRGPDEPLPWGEDGQSKRPTTHLDALAPGGVYSDREDGPRLLTPLSED